jgi:glycosyltransferase involved in cell wall biosynthesis
LGDGAEGIHIREMVKAFRDLGHEVRIIGPVGEQGSHESSRSRTLGRIKRVVPAVLYEVLEILYTGYCFAITARAIRAFGPDVIYDRYITFNAGTVLAGRMFRVPVCLEVNAPLAMERSREQDEKLVFRRIASWMEKWICTNATWTIVVSTPLKEYLELIGVPAGKCIVMPNGADAERFAPRQPDALLRERLGIPVDRFVIGFTGVLRPWHGLDLLVTAVSGMAKRGLKVHLLVVGDGPYRATLEKMVEASGLAGLVCVTGRVPHEQVAGYVALFDVAVSPRATFYASPMKVLEYMALGKPVVVPGTANFLDIITDRWEGITFEEGNADSLERALTSLCREPELRRTLGLRARQKVESRLNWRWNAREVCRLVSEGTRRTVLKGSV